MKGKPTIKPAVKPAPKPAARLIAKPAAKPPAKPAAKSMALVKPAAKPLAKSAAKAAPMAGKPGAVKPAPMAAKTGAMKPASPMAGKAVRRADETDLAARKEAEIERLTKRSGDLSAMGAKGAPAPAAAPAPVKHTVAAGETLSHISDKYYKTPNRWKEIYEANKAVIGPNAGMIKPGQVLVIPGVTK